MQNKTFTFYLDRLFLILTSVFIFMGSCGIFKDYCIPLSIANALLFLGIKLVWGTEVRIPKHFKLYALFTTTLLLHFFIFGGKIIYFWMFLSGGLYWVSIYNIRTLAEKYFFPFIYFLGLMSLFLFIYFKLIGTTYLSPDNLFLPIKDGLLHNHIGDIWAVILVSVFYKVITKFKTCYIPLIIIGFIMIVLSFSRSSVITLAVGIAYVLYRLNLRTKKNIAILAALICSSIFIYFSIYKSTIFARPYFEEAIYSLLKTPLGFGMGNFSNVSTETNVVHNLVLEVIGGMGVFSSIFIFWLYKVGETIYNNKNINIEFSAIFIALFVNFFFDSTYVIPGLFWIWFVALALI